jgi:F0F1-type ATP synthase epsilon subunit
VVEVMAEDIAFKILIPSKVIADKKIYRAVVPYDGKTLTVMKGRAPVLLALDMGVISVLNEKLDVVEEYLIANGSADITEDSCTILCEGAYNTQELDLEKALELKEEHPFPYFQWMAEYLAEKSKK